MSVSNFDVQSQTLWQAWQDLQSQADEALKKGAAHYFTCIRKAACSALALEALASARLGQSDEGVFNHLVYIMQTYREVISLFDSPIKDTSPDLVEGLCDILGSRLRQFEDDTSGPGNPVAREKYAILEKAIVDTARQIEDLEKSFALEPQAPAGANCVCEPAENEPAGSAQPHPSIALLTGNATAAWQTLRDTIIEENIPSIHAIFTQNLQACQSNIDDLHARKTASYYTDLLEREWEVLGLIIQVQVKAIEAAFEAAAGCATEEPDTAADLQQEPPEAAQDSTQDAETESAASHNAAHSLHPILSKLREAYQQTGPIVSGLRKMMQTASPARPAPGSDYEDFARVLAAGMTEPPPPCIGNQPLTAALLPEADAKFESIRTSGLELISNLQLSSADEITLAKDVIAVFEKAAMGLKSIREESAAACAPTEPEEPHDITPPQAEPESSGTTGTPQEPPMPEAPQANNIEAEILSGIAETLEIKVESLTESLEFFQENSANLLDSVYKGLPVLSEESLVTAASQMLAAWCANPPAPDAWASSSRSERPAPDAIAGFLADCVSLDVFASYAGQFAKHIETSSSRIEKASFRFKKETLLYEISTYEEILYHSVSRLRESALPHIAAAVNLLDETFSALENLLAQNGITVIRPAPHEPFNGREHEVLIAEETEGFAKGEIIKVMTSGYKLNEQVILRANVIAAR